MTEEQTEMDVLADIIAMRDRMRAASIGWQADPIADQINEALEAQR